MRPVVDVPHVTLRRRCSKWSFVEEALCGKTSSLQRKSGNATNFDIGFFSAGCHCGVEKREGEE
jgi:hypothetical protein